MEDAVARANYARHRFPPAISAHAVWLYCRFALSYRDVEELLVERGVVLTSIITGPDVTLQPVFAPRPAFKDVTPQTTGAIEPIAQLAARGIIKGCDPQAGLFCPTDQTLRA